MSRRSTAIVIAAVAALAVGVGLGVGVVGRSSDVATTPHAAYRGSTPPTGFQLVDFDLRDQRGKLVRARALRGKVVVLTFLDSQCHESCPVVAGIVADGLRRLGKVRGSAVAVAISTDPAGDTGASRKAFLRRHRAAGEIRYVSGRLAELEPLWRRFQILSSHESGADELHSAPVRVYDPAGTWVSTLHAGADLTPANLAHDVRVALGEAGTS